MDHSSESNRLMSNPPGSTDISPCEFYMVFWINGLIDYYEQRRGDTTNAMDKLHDICNIPDDDRYIATSSNDDDDDDDDDEPYSLFEQAENQKYDFRFFWGELEPSEIDELCDASEDYEHFKEGCDYAYANISPDWEDDD